MEQIYGNQTNRGEFAEGLGIPTMDFTPFLSDLIYESSTAPLSMQLSLSGTSQNRPHQPLGEYSDELEQESLNSFPYVQRHHREDIATGYLSYSLLDESLAFLESINTPPNLSLAGYDTPCEPLSRGPAAFPVLTPSNSDGSSNLYPHPVEQLIDNAMGPSDIVAAEPFSQPISGRPHAHSPCAGSPNSTDGVWRCAYRGCKSRKVFTRMCDFRRHFQYHIKYFSCGHPDCPQAAKGNFATRKDRDRHEAMHKPNVKCIWEGCERVFSRKDNMHDHVRRIHQKGSHYDLNWGLGKGGQSYDSRHLRI